MNILIVGAGAVGGYFGGRLHAAGRRVTFLVRPGRAAQLARTGLVIRSASGDAQIFDPPIVLASGIRSASDLVLLSCKSYDLASAMDALAPAVGPETIVVPLLNGMRHLDELDARFGPGRIFGGRCLISARLDENGHVEHLSDINEITFGGRSAEQNNRLAAVTEALGGARFDARASDQILLEMWEKWIFIATLAGVSCLMRASIGDVVEAGGSDLAVELLEECRSIAEGEGHAPREAFVEWAKGRLTEPGSSLTASMLGDLERGSRTEADHILGDLLRRGVRQGPSSLLKAAYTALKAQELSFGSPRSPETHARSGYSPRPESA